MVETGKSLVIALVLYEIEIQDIIVIIQLSIVFSDIHKEGVQSDSC